MTSRKLTRVLIYATVFTTSVVCPASARTLADDVNNFVRGTWIVAGSILALIIVWGGFRILASSGNPELYKSGKNIIRNGIVSYILLACATAITYTFSNLPIKPLILVPP